MGTNDKYPLHTGYLTKSPPENRVTGNFKRWLKRWFVLWEDKTLEYYRERGDPKPKKTIDLSRCESLDTNLSDKKFKNIFSLRVNGDKDHGRTYFLAADTAYEMKNWVDKICNLCEFTVTENKNTDTTICRHQAPLDKEVIPVRPKERDSGIIVPDNDTADLVPVKIVNTDSVPAYDDLPPPRPSKTSEGNNGQYDVPPQFSQSPGKSPVQQRNSCPLDMSSSSESSLTSIKRSSGGSDIYQNYDVAPTQPTYDIPSTQSTYDIPPPQSTYDILPPQPTYDVPPTQPTYDVPPTQANHEEALLNRYSGGSSGEDGNDIYDVPPSSLPAYDILPAPVSATSTMPGISRVAYNNIPQQYGNYNALSPHIRPGLQRTNYSTLPPGNAGMQSIYDHVPSRNHSTVTYDTPPSRPETLPSAYTSCNYDYVPPPKPALHGDNTDGQEDAPPVPREAKPAALTKAYVNLTIPFEDGEYNKPLPSTPREMQRDSGTVLDDEEAVYDVPPAQQGHPQVPIVNRRSKPDMAVSPPRVDRTSKPSVTGRDYVNLRGPIATRSATFKESSNQPARKGGNVQRSKSAVVDFESEAGYLYMESPKRTESSTRYSKKDRRSSIPEEDGAYEYMSLQRNEQNTVYQNCNTPTQITPTKESSPERTVPALRGHYQDISVVCQRESRDIPSVPQRSKTQYTTIDVEKTKAFRKTCEDAEKGQ